MINFGDRNALFEILELAFHLKAALELNCCLLRVRQSFVDSEDGKWC